MEEINEKNRVVIFKYLKANEKAKKNKRQFYRFVRKEAEKGVSQKELAYICGLSRQRINEIIHHKVK